jgi:5'-nucleotidase
VRNALAAGVAAATLLPTASKSRVSPHQPHDQLRIAFDGDAVIFDDEGERVSREGGLAAFAAHEREHAGEPLLGGARSAVSSMPCIASRPRSRPESCRRSGPHW